MHPWVKCPIKLRSGNETAVDYAPQLGIYIGKILTFSSENSWYLEDCMLAYWLQNRILGFYFFLSLKWFKFIITIHKKCSSYACYKPVLVEHHPPHCLGLETLMQKKPCKDKRAGSACLTILLTREAKPSSGYYVLMCLCILYCISTKNTPESKATLGAWSRIILLACRLEFSFQCMQDESSAQVFSFFSFFTWRSLFLGSGLGFLKSFQTLLLVSSISCSIRCQSKASLCWSMSLPRANVV